MSKTKGNVIDPLDIIERFGTDATRFTLAAMAAPGTDIAFNESRTDGYRAFANKIWNAARFMFMNVDRIAPESAARCHPSTRLDSRPSHTSRRSLDSLPLQSGDRDVNEAHRRPIAFTKPRIASTTFSGASFAIGTSNCQAATAGERKRRNGADGLRKSRESVRRRAAAAASGDAVYHGRNLARDVCRRAAAEVDRAGGVSVRRTKCRLISRRKPKWPSCRT